MPLSQNVIAQKGKTLSVTTDFGFGWLEYDPQRHTKRMDVPSNFDFIAEDFWELQGRIVAVLGRVIQPQHFLDGFELCALPVPYSEIDFAENQGNYNLLLSPKRSRLTGMQPPPHFDSIEGGGYPEFRGYARSIRTK